MRLLLASDGVTETDEKRAMPLRADEQRATVIAGDDAVARRDHRRQFQFDEQRADHGSLKHKLLVGRENASHRRAIAVGNDDKVGVEHPTVDRSDKRRRLDVVDAAHVAAEMNLDALDGEHSVEQQ